ncbi:hypothetical protein Plhal304r1_c060g0146631 [Plasmopara halstedii]
MWCQITAKSDYEVLEALPFSPNIEAKEVGIPQPTATGRWEYGGRQHEYLTKN